MQLERGGYRAGYSSMKPQQLEVAVAIVEGMQGHFFAVLSRILEKSLLTSGV